MEKIERRNEVAQRKELRWEHREGYEEIEG